MTSRNCSKVSCTEIIRINVKSHHGEKKKKKPTHLNNTIKKILNKIKQNIVKCKKYMKVITYTVLSVGDCC